MKKNLTQRHSKILFFAAAALVSQVDASAPGSACLSGTLGYNITTGATPGAGSGASLEPSLTPHCAEPDENGYKIYKGNGGPGDEYYIVNRNGFTTNPEAAAAALSVTNTVGGGGGEGGAGSGSNSAPKSPATSVGGDAVANLGMVSGALSTNPVAGAVGGMALQEKLKSDRGSAVLLSEAVRSPDIGQQEIGCLGVELPAGNAVNPPASALPSPILPPPSLPPVVERSGEPGRSPASTTLTSSPVTVAGSTLTPAPPAANSATGGGNSPIQPDAATVSIPPPLPGGPDSHVSGSVLDAMNSAATLTDASRGQDILDMATSTRQAIIAAASDDQQTLAAPYRDLSSDALAENLQRAQASLSDSVGVLENATGSSIESSERARFHNFFLNARDKAQLGLDAIHENQADAAALGEDSPFKGLLGAKDANPLAKNEALAGIFGPQLGAATTSDSLVNRMVMLNGLPAAQRQDALAKLKLLEQPSFILPNGTRVSINLLHNGYLLGGGSTAVDCSSFVSSILPADVRRGRFTTLDFRTMWIYDKTFVFPSPPRYSTERAKLVKDTATAFIPIDLYSGEHLRVGDLLIYRFLNDPIGHIVIVRSYNPATLRAEIVEAAQSAGTVRERTLNLSPDPLEAKRRLLMPGLFALRIKPVSNQACHYRDGLRSPASSGVRPARIVEPHGSSAGDGP